MAGPCRLDPVVLNRVCGKGGVLNALHGHAGGAEDMDACVFLTAALVVNRDAEVRAESVELVRDLVCAQPSCAPPLLILLVYQLNRYG